MNKIKIKAPTVLSIKIQEKKEADAVRQGRQEQDKRYLREKQREDEKNAELIIAQLIEMFANKNVSGVEGCSICSIPENYCTDGVLKIINDYLNGEWLAEFIVNTGNAHDFETSNTLVVKPKN